MSRAVAIGATRRLDGFALAGVAVREANTADEVRATWRELEQDVGLVVLTADAAAALEGEQSEREGLVWVTLPD